MLRFRLELSPFLGPPVGASGPAATGGTETVIDDGGTYYRVHAFTGDGTLTFSRDTDVEYLIVAGGGSGGEVHQYESAGGGGAGGLLTNVGGTLRSVTSGAKLITVGDGGQVILDETEKRIGTPGEDSTFDGLTAFGGGGGYAQNFTVGSTSDINGGSGGGINIGSSLGTPGQGNDGGVYAPGGAGGGGAGAVGGSDPDRFGGDGLSNDITGTDVTYAGGGAGIDNPTTTTDAGLGGAGGGGDYTSVNGVDGLGGGGAGGGYNAGYSVPAGSGGSGIVIVRYEITEAEYLAA